MNARRLSAVAFVLAWTAAAAADDPVVARLAGTDVKASEIRQLLDGLDPAARKQATADTKSLLAFVRGELGRRAVLEDAKGKKWDQRPEVAAKIERARNDVVLSTYIASVTAPDSAAVTDDEVKAMYDANLGRFMQPRRYHLAQIYVAVADGAAKSASDAAQAKAQDLAKKAKAAGADFAALAKANSDDKASAARGGDLGWLPENQLVPAVASAVQGLTDNEVSAPVQAKDGWHVLRELGTKPAGPAPLDEVKPTIVAALREQVANRAAQAYLEKLLTDEKAAVNEIELGKLVENPGG